jgi:tRNA threonylcarbamoyladenosine biosynthesis protein TsaE
VALSGELGSGKTRLAQGIAEGLRIDASHRICSPSFALIHEYEGVIPLYHMDFYRLSPEIWEPDLGLETYLWSEGVSVIEWAERMAPLLPDDRLEINLVVLGARKRTLDFRAFGKNHRTILEALVAEEQDSGRGRQTPSSDRGKTASGGM